MGRLPRAGLRGRIVSSCLFTKHIYPTFGRFAVIGLSTVAIATTASRVTRSHLGTIVYGQTNE